MQISSLNYSGNWQSQSLEDACSIFSAVINALLCVSLQAWHLLLNGRCEMYITNALELRFITATQLRSNGESVGPLSEEGGNE